MPYALALGISEERFWDSCPVDLKPYEKAYEIRLKRKDEQMWMQGMYFYNALSVSLSHFCGNKRSKYIAAPLLCHAFEEKEERNLSDAQKENYVNQLFTNLMVMQANFNNSHMDKK